MIDHENCLERLMICMYCDIVYSIRVLVPHMHARDDCETLLFNLGAFLLGVVQCVRCETERPIVL